MLNWINFKKRKGKGKEVISIFIWIDFLGSVKKEMEGIREIVNLLYFLFYFLSKFERIREKET